MEAAAARGKFEKTEETIKNESKEAEGSRDQLFAFMKAIEEKKGARSDIIHQQDMLLEKSRMRTSSGRDRQNGQGRLKRTLPRRKPCKKRRHQELNKKRGA